jgi:hypothetical protein
MAALARPPRTKQAQVLDVIDALLANAAQRPRPS